MTFHCIKCNKYFNSSIGYNNHLNKSKEHNEHNENKKLCSFCNKEFNKPYLVKRHEKSCKKKINYENSNLAQKYKELELLYNNLFKEFEDSNIVQKYKELELLYNNLFKEFEEYKKREEYKYIIMKEKYDTAMEINSYIKNIPTIIYNDNSISNEYIE